MSDFLRLVAQENNAEAKDVLFDMLGQRIAASLDERKKEIADSLFNGTTEEN